MTDNIFDAIADEAKGSSKSTGKTVEPTTQDKAPAAKTKNAPKQAKPAKKKETDFNAVPFDRYPLSAVAGQVTASVTTSDTSVPVLKLALLGWVGVEPLVIPAANLNDIRAVLDEIEKQANKK